MIIYDHGRWGLTFLLSCRGTVFPKAIALASPAGAISAGMTFMRPPEDVLSPNWMIAAFATYMTVLGFMVVFRSNQAWSRYWEGAHLIQQVRGEWFSAASSIFAFCNTDESKSAQVVEYQHQVARLMSLLFATGLRSLSGCDLPVIDQAGISSEAGDYLEELHSSQSQVQTQLVMQWIQRLIVHGAKTGTLDVAAPILSRVFQELSRGMVNIASAQKINELQFPFHYAQLLAVMLIVFTMGASVTSAWVFTTWWGAGGTTFLNVFVLWGCNFLAVEIESPFGEQPNDLPVQQEMNRFNSLLRMLLEAEAQTVPNYSHNPLDVDDLRAQLLAPTVRSAPTIVRVHTTRDPSRVGSKERLSKARQSMMSGFWGMAGRMTRMTTTFSMASTRSRRTDMTAPPDKEEPPLPAVASENPPSCLSPTLKDSRTPGPPTPGSPSSAVVAIRSGSGVSEVSSGDPFATTRMPSEDVHFHVAHMHKEMATSSRGLRAAAPRTPSEEVHLHVAHMHQEMSNSSRGRRDPATSQPVAGQPDPAASQPVGIAEEPEQPCSAAAGDAAASGGIGVQPEPPPQPVAPRPHSLGGGQSTAPVAKQVEPGFPLELPLSIDLQAGSPGGGPQCLGLCGAPVARQV